MMDENGQTYFDFEDKIPEADARRLKEALRKDVENNLERVRNEMKTLANASSISE
jgi:hypothetical protein